MQIRALHVFGTRPEAIKLAPIIRQMAVDPNFVSLVCLTGQHDHLLSQMTRLFDIRADYNLDVMTERQDLCALSSRILSGLETVFQDARPDLVLVQGDTTSCLMGALASFYNRVPLAHVEAGLRSHSLAAPFPEEGNRIVVSRLARFHFAPTPSARENLLRENVDPELISMTGNTVIDSLHWAVQRIETNPTSSSAGIPIHLEPVLVDTATTVILITGHRRENFGAGFAEICSAISSLALDHQDWHFIYPVHLNPNVRKPVNDILAGQPNVWLLEPLEYLPFIRLMMRADLVLTDSGGIQEEAPSLGKPVLVMRDVTERPEAVAAGTVALVGCNAALIKSATERILGDRHVYERMARAHNPYGDGRATERILGVLKTAFADPHRQSP